ncbi:MAG: plasmid pRiA4b ORF-3 family protein [Desulfobacula sp.]|nr:plasmid pRiA4b ORF-3 family protein [Desulfobacula sp.]
MIWTLKIKVCGMRPECSRLIEIDSGASFLALHDAIQEAVDFADDHMFEFYVGRNPGNRAFSIGGDPDWDSFDPVKTYGRILLKDVWPLPEGMKLFYLFDFGDNWLFQITKTRRKDKTPEQGVKYPRVVEAKGENPEQYPDWNDDDEDY